MNEFQQFVVAFDFGRPWFLLLLPALGPLLWLLGRPGPVPAVRFSSVALLRSVAVPGPRLRPHAFRAAAKLGVLILLVVALAQPRIDRGVFEQEAEGIDIMLVLDISFSMEATDLRRDGQPASRFEVVRNIVGEFIERREFDRVGVIGFARDAYLVSPLTLDKDWVRQCMEYVEFQGGTNIGGGMDAATRFLSASESSTRIAILLTDGGQTVGTDPSEAIPRAKEAGIRFYTAAIVSPQRNNPTIAAAHPLADVARETGGQFFLASDSEALRAIYDQIDKLESTTFRQSRSSAYQDLFPWLVIPAFTLLIVGELYRSLVRKEIR